MNRRLLLLGSAALVLAIVLLLDRGWPPSGGRADLSAPAGEPPAEAVRGKPATLNPLEGLAAEDFAAMLERPLFNPGRAARPPEPPPAPPPPVEEPQFQPPPGPARPVAADYALVAVAAGPSGRIAAVRLAATGEVLYLREGEPVQSWSVIAIGERSVVIGTPESNVSVFLFDDMGDGVGTSGPDPAAAGFPGDLGMDQDPSDEADAALEDEMMR